MNESPSDVWCRAAALPERRLATTCCTPPHRTERCPSRAVVVVVVPAATSARRPRHRHLRIHAGPRPMTVTATTTAAASPPHTVYHRE